MSTETEVKEELIKRTEVVNTPFTIIETPEGKFLAMGKYRLTEPMENMVELLAEANEFNWNRMVQVTMILIQQVMGTNEILEKINKEE